MSQLALEPTSPVRAPVGRNETAGGDSRSRTGARRSGSYAAQREVMVARAREVFPDADKIEAFAAPEEPYLIIWRGRKGFYCPWWEIE